MSHFQWTLSKISYTIKFSNFITILQLRIMPTNHETPRDLRKKLSRAAVSHKALRDKYRATQYELKKYKVSLSAARTNRNKWRLLAKEADALAIRLQIELNKISQERDSLATKIKEVDVLESKKKRNRF